MEVIWRVFDIALSATILFAIKKGLLSLIERWFFIILF